MIIIFLKNSIGLESIERININILFSIIYAFNTLSIQNVYSYIIIIKHFPNDMNLFVKNIDNNYLEFIVEFLVK
jgi:hypothetical protein